MVETFAYFQKDSPIVPILGTLHPNDGKWAIEEVDVVNMGNVWVVLIAYGWIYDPIGDLS